MFHSHLFQQKYRIASSRLLGWDYRSPGFYFVTWKVKYNAPLLGKIIRGFMHHSILGKIVLDEIYETMIIRSGVYIDTVAVMPDHVHVLFEFDRNVPVDVEAARRAASTSTLQSNSLGSVIGQIKSKTTKRIRKIIPGFFWQSRFHDRVVRSSELDRIRKYIQNNSLHHGHLHVRHSGI